MNDAHIRGRQAPMPMQDIACPRSAREGKGMAERPLRLAAHILVRHGADAVRLIGARLSGRAQAFSKRAVLQEGKHGPCRQGFVPYAHEAAKHGTEGRREATKFMKRGGEMMHDSDSAMNGLNENEQNLTSSKLASSKQRGIDRRGFIKTAIAASTSAAAMAALPGCTNQSGPENETATVSNTSGVPADGYQVAGDWLGEPPIVSDADISEEYDGDIIVLGGGNSGIQAALAAAEGGAKVHVIEKETKEGRKVKGQDVGHVNSQWLISQGFGPYDEGEITDEFLKRCNGRNNPEIVRRFVLNSGEMFDNMIGLVRWPDDRIRLAEFSDPAINPLDPSEMIVHQSGAVLDGPVHYPISQGGYKTWASTAQFPGALQHYPQEDGRSGRPSECSRLDEVQQFSILKGEELGAEWHYEQTAQVLISDDSGAVTGALCEKPDGSFVRYNASKGVILCTGDFGGNVDMSWSLLGEISEWAQRAGVGPEDIKAYSSCQGEGHKMGCWAGGMIEPLPRPTMAFFMSGGTPWGTTPYLWLNANGERYMNEAAVQLSWQLNLRQPLGDLYTLTDSKWYEIMKMAGVDHGSPNCGHEEFFTELKEDMDKVPLGSPEGGQCRNCTQTGRSLSTVFAADNLNELCELLGMDSETKVQALASVERYNSLCATGIDGDFSKDGYLMQPIDTPPFYGCLGSNKRWDWVGLVSLAGLVTDNYLQVLDKDGGKIEGLWAAGNCLGGRYGNGYATPMAGNSIGMALTHGRVAGKVATGQPVR